MENERLLDVFKQMALNNEILIYMLEKHKLPLACGLIGLGLVPISFGTGLILENILKNGGK